MTGKPLREVLQRRRARFKSSVLDQQVGPVEYGAGRQAGVRSATGALQRLQSGIPLTGLQIGERQIVVGPLRATRVETAVQRRAQLGHRTGRITELQRRLTLHLKQPGGEVGCLLFPQRRVGPLSRQRELLHAQVQEGKAHQGRSRQWAFREQFQVPAEAFRGFHGLPGQQRGIGLRVQRLRRARAARVRQHDAPERLRRLRVAACLIGELSRAEQRVGLLRCRQFIDNGQVGAFGILRAAILLQGRGVQQQGAPAVVRRSVAALELHLGPRDRLGRAPLSQPDGRLPVAQDRNVLGFGVQAGERPQQVVRVRVAPQMVVGEGEQEAGVGAQLGVRVALDQRRERVRGVGEQTVGERVGAPLVEVVRILSGCRQGQRQQQGHPQGARDRRAPFEKLRQLR